MNGVFENIKNELQKLNDEMSKYVCCFTGYRPQKLPWGFNESDPRFLDLKARVKKTIKEAINLGYRHFISGMALGFDMLCAEIVLDFKLEMSDIVLECALPCKDQAKLWSSSQQLIWKKILSQADKIRCVYERYCDGCMEERNKYMVNNSSLVIALFDGKSGGTMKTVNYANKNGVKVIEIPPVQSKIDEVVGF